MERYGLTDDKLDKLDRVLYLQGSYDFITGTGMPKLTESNDPNHAKVILTQVTAHTEDGFSTAVMAKGVRPQLDDVRTLKLEYIKAWLGMKHNIPGHRGDVPVQR